MIRNIKTKCEINSAPCFFILHLHLITKTNTINYTLYSFKLKFIKSIT